MKIRLLGAHNLESRDTRHTCLLLDGVLGLDVGSLASALSPKEQTEVRAILVTHGHFDHIRDLPTLGLSTRDDPRPIDVYALGETLDSLHAHLLDGDVYPDLTQGLNGAAPRFRFNAITPWEKIRVLGYQVKPIPVSHAAPSVGYIVKSDTDHCMAYTGDTGGDLSPFFEDELEPEVVFVDVTFPNRLEHIANVSGHLTPRLLRNQLLELVRKSVRLPRIVPVHLSMTERDEVTQELESVSSELGIDLVPGYTDMQVF